MTFFISLILAFAFAWFGAKLIKKRAKLFYLGCTALALLTVFTAYSGLDAGFPAFVLEYIWPLFENCALATAIFVVVMLTGALTNGSAAIKRLMPIRAELSIMASILTLGHNIAYGKSYFVWLFTAPERLSGALLYAALCSVLMILIMLPLMITSFPAIRKKMKARSWKKLQRTAYLFYGLIYVHVMLLNVTFLAGGQNKYLLNILLYSLVFWGYGVLRLRKALLKKKSPLLRPLSICCGGFSLALTAALCILPMLPEAAEPSSLPVQEDAVLSQEAEAPDSLVSPEGAADAEEVPGANAEEHGLGSFSPPQEGDPAAEPQPLSYTDGTYFGVGDGYNGEIKVAVTIAEGEISSVLVVTSKEDEPYWSDARSLLDVILAGQSTEVDVVSGATFSSEGLIAAVENALEQAK